jgi:hypothetical protein
MYLFCNSRIHVITLYSGHVCVYYASMLQCWHLVWILVRTDHPCLGVGCHTLQDRQSIAQKQKINCEDKKIPGLSLIGETNKNVTFQNTFARDTWLRVSQLKAVHKFTLNGSPST